MKLLEPLDKMKMREQIEYLKSKYYEILDLYLNNFDTFSPIVDNFQKELEEECKKFDSVYQEMNEIVLRFDQIKQNIYNYMKENRKRIDRLEETKKERELHNKKRVNANDTNSPL